MLNHPNRLKAVANLEGQYRIAHLLVEYRLEVMFGCAKTAQALAEAGHATDEHNAFQVQRLAELFTCVIQALTDTVAANTFIDADFHSIEPVAIGVVASAIAVGGDRFPGVRLEANGAAHPKGGAVADDVFVERDNKFTFGKVVELTAQFCRGVGIDAGALIHTL